MIPKIIHFCWISGDKYPKFIKDCMESWKTNAPDYQIKQWTYADLIKIKDLPLWVYIALKNKKYAFVSDYVRAYVIYNYGGFYFDSDIELTRPIPENLLHYKFVSTAEETLGIYNGLNTIDGYTYGIGIEAAMFGGEQNNKVCKSILDFYNTEYGKIFDIEKVNKIYWQKYFPLAPQVFARVCHDSFGFDYNAPYKINDDEIHITEDLCISIYAYDHNCTPEQQSKVTAIHHCIGSWKTVKYYFRKYDLSTD